MIRVIVWNEFRQERVHPEVRAVYPDGIHAAIAAGLRAPDLEVRTGTLDEPERGLPADLLDATDVLTEEKVRIAERKNDYYRQLIEAIAPSDLLPGVGARPAGLRARGVRTAIASMSHNVWDLVDRLGIRAAIDLIVDPAALVKGKPDPEIFLTAAEQLGVRFENCVGIEDAKAGIEAIKAAGMRAVGVGSDPPGADWVVGSTADHPVEGLVALVGARAEPGR